MGSGQYLKLVEQVLSEQRSKEEIQKEIDSLYSHLRDPYASHSRHDKDRIEGRISQLRDELYPPPPPPTPEEISAKNLGRHNEAVAKKGGSPENTTEHHTDSLYLTKIKGEGGQSHIIATPKQAGSMISPKVHSFAPSTVRPGMLSHSINGEKQQGAEPGKEMDAVLKYQEPGKYYKQPEERPIWPSNLTMDGTFPYSPTTQFKF